MNTVRTGRIYAVVAVIVIFGLCVSTAVGALAGGAVVYYLARRVTYTSSIEPSTQLEPIEREEAPLSLEEAERIQVETISMDELLARIYDRVNPSVVNISVAVPGQTIFTPFGPFPSLPEDEYQYGLGSGFVYDLEGHIVTNNHVVAEAERLTVTFYDDTSVPATIVGRDPDSDLAVIKVDAKGLDLVPVELGDSDTVKVGQQVVAMGSPFGFAGTMTMGIISGLGRSLPSTEVESGSTYIIPEVIQTDAAINPGNSGGPLLDLQGRVIAVNTAIESPVRGSTGVGFSIPVSLVKLIVPVLIEKGAYEYPWLGISGSTLAPEAAEAMGLPRNQRGVIIAEITPNSPADIARLRPSNSFIPAAGQQAPVGGDIITAIDGQPVKKFEDLVIYLIRHTRVGDEVTLTVLRNRETVSVQVTLAARPKGSE